ncbi:hypothetical protein LZG74_18995 [Dyadobacter sp. CY327]|uniref:hypothetical protein n=1 Tax=Dyadobacter sp. CY327 TaxID=2907301 RepID=UPI001F40BB60|nr:hypothetical protein [Dyadobacter sp. CY327]MCE7072413.1 hypothetical protein [Dyadobacter sp. CY327]
MQNLLKTDNQEKAMNRPFLLKEYTKKTAVVVPNEEWEQLQAKLRKQKILDSLARGLKEVKLMKEGKLPKPHINDLFKD